MGESLLQAPQSNGALQWTGRQPLGVRHACARLLDTENRGHRTVSRKRDANAQAPPTEGESHGTLSIWHILILAWSRFCVRRARQDSD